MNYKCFAGVHSPMVAEAEKKGNAGNLKVHRDAKKNASRCILASQKTTAEWHCKRIAMHNIKLPTSDAKLFRATLLP